MSENEMLCKTCRRWVDGWCLAQQMGTPSDKVCNAWELSLVVDWVSEKDALNKRIADLREDNATLGDSNAWIKQNYEDLERDYGVMYDKMCARIDKLTAENKVLEDAWEILRKENRRLFSQVFLNGKPEPKVCEACGGDGTVLLRDGYEGQVIATAKCIYCNGTGRVSKEREE